MAATARRRGAGSRRRDRSASRARPARRRRGPLCSRDRGDHVGQREPLFNAQRGDEPARPAVGVSGRVLDGHEARRVGREAEAREGGRQQRGVGRAAVDVEQHLLARDWTVAGWVSQRSGDHVRPDAGQRLVKGQIPDLRFARRPPGELRPLIDPGRGRAGGERRQEGGQAELSPVQKGHALPTCPVCHRMLATGAIAGRGGSSAQRRPAYSRQRANSGSRPRGPSAATQMSASE